MSSPASLETFTHELNRLVAKFEKEFTAVTDPGYSEARLRQDYLDPFIRALGWDLENHAGLVQQHREVEIESRTDVAGRAKRADYLFRTDRRDRFVCEAKKPRVTLGPRDAFQAKRYAWNKKVHLALLTDFEDLKIFLVGGKPHKDLPDVGLWKHWHFRQYPLVAAEIWQLLARENVAAGSIESAIDKLPKRAPAGRGKARQLYLIKPDRTRELDTDFLEFLDEARRELAGDILRHNDRADILADGRLNEAVQSILDRLLFIRICEDRDIDTGTRLQSIVETWQRAWERDDGKKHRQEHLRIGEEPPDMDGTGGGGGRSRLPRESLWRAVVQHLRALDRRPPSHVPFFNGNLFKPHFSEDLLLGDTWLAEFIGELSDDESPYLFNVIPVEILGSVYERFLGKVVRPHGRGVTIEEKPEVRKAGGVYYTPRYIVDYIVEQTVGRQLDGIAGIPAPLRGASDLESGSGGSASLHHRLISDQPSGLEDARTTAPVPKGRRKLAGGVSHRIAGPADPAPAGAAEALRFATFERTTRALRLLDPACGSGSFLIRAFERVCEHWQRRFTQHPQDRRPELCWTDPVTADVHLTVALKRRILRDNIYGVDLDAQAVEVTQLSLYLKMLEGEDRITLQRQRELFKDEPALLPPLGNNIKCGNSLVASDFSLVPEDLLRVNAFDWETGFRAIMRAGGFDAVIGNPPYIRIQGFPADQVGYFVRNYKAATGNYDIYVNFAERSLGLLNATGRSGMILPNKFFRTDYGTGLRTVIAERKALFRIVDFGSSQVFDATTYTCLLFLTKTPRPDFELGISVASSEALAATTFLDCPTDSLSAKAWTLLSADEAQLQDKMKAAGKRLLDLPADMSRGSSTGDDETFVVEPLGHSFEAGCLRTPLFASDFGRYSFAPEGKWQVIFPYACETGHARLREQAELRKLFPNAFAHLQANTARLKTRKQFKEWFGYSAPRNLDLHDRAQIAVPLLANRGLFSLIPPTYRGKLCPMASGGFTISLGEDCPLRPEYLLGILNSTLMFWFLGRISNVFRGGWITCTKQYFGELPIRSLDLSLSTDRARHDALVSLVDKMLALVPKLRAETRERERAVLANAVQTTDRKIDELVYALYGLTPEEIALVEGGK